MVDTDTVLTAAQSAVRMHQIRVQFGRLVANDNVDIDVGQGEIQALLGENGAGKTTLMRVLAGLLQPQSGEIFVFGRRVEIETPLKAASLGIGMVHQHFMLIPTMSVAENVALGLRSLRPLFPDLGAVARRLEQLGRDYGLEVDPHALVGSLSVAGQQRVEILKQLYRGARILVLDEPTAVLTPQEADRLFAVLRSLAGAGTSIIFISHKLHEVMAVTDRITVLRRGRVVGRLETATTSEAEIARLMVGEDIAAAPMLPGGSQRSEQPLLEADGLVVDGERGVRAVDGVSFVLRAGEILGVAGVDGNGQQALAEAVVGLRPLSAGTLTLSGTDIGRLPIAARLRRGLAHIPEDRHRTAIFEPLSIAENIVAERLGNPAYGRFGLIDGRAMRATATAVIEDYDVRCESAAQPIGMLSGGNQQKVVLGRALSRDPKIIVAVQPTRGLDIGATRFLHAQLLEHRARGAAILLVSMELDELQALCDRIMVMRAGRVAGIVDRADVGAERIGMLMAGGEA